MDERRAESIAQLQRLINGYQVTRAIHVAVTLGLPDLVASGARDAAALASATGTHPDALYRLLRALAALGIFRELPGRRFEQTALSELLRADAPVSLAGWAMFVGRDSQWLGWRELLHSVKTGESGVTHALGVDSWTYRAQHPEETAIFDQAMTAVTSITTPVLLEAYDYGRFTRLADIAGGHGALLGAIVARHPRMRGVLFDQPHVVAGAPKLLAGLGVASRVDVVAGSFFESVPAADGYMLKHILHDWYDDDCVRILRTIRAAAPPGARLLVIERRLGGPNDVPSAKFSDLNMLVGPGGRERSVEEYAALLQRSGFSLAATHAAGTHDILEATVA
jgi:hypothetical protein